MALDTNTHEITTTMPGTSNTTNDAFKVDFSWKKRKVLISNARTGQNEYIIHCNWISRPSLEFKRFDNPDLASSYTSGDKTPPATTTIGIGNIHPVKIHADCEVHGQAIKVKARSHFKTQYEHLSYAFNPSADNPTTLAWTTSWSMKNWDFICLSPSQEPVARFSSNIWAVKKLGLLEFIDPNMSAEVREEMLVTAFTLWYCMVQRSNNILNFFGAFFADTKPVTEEEGKSGRGGKKVVKGLEGEEVNGNGGVGKI